MPKPTALIRPVPDSFERALTREGRPDLDVGAARAQHDVYRGHLAKAGYEVDVVSSDESHPDCVFIEDTAVVLGSVAVITRPGARSRRGETGPVAQALSDRFPIVEIAEPGTIDGGDVFVAEGTVYVGRSSRTNQEAIDQLRAIALGQGMELVVVDVLDTLHLKSAVLPIDTHTVVVTPSAVDEAPLRHLRILYEAATERHRFSALPLHDDTVLVTANAPATAEMVTDLGRNVIPIDVSQIQAADGGLTCMSILF